MLSAEAGEFVPMTGYLGGEDDAHVPIAANGAWGSEDTYTVSICRYRTAFASTYDMRFAGDKVFLERSSIGAEESGWVRFIGTAQS